MMHQAIVGKHFKRKKHSWELSSEKYHALRSDKWLAMGLLLMGKLRDFPDFSHLCSLIFKG